MDYTCRRQWVTSLIGYLACGLLTIVRWSKLILFGFNGSLTLYVSYLDSLVTHKCAEDEVVDNDGIDGEAWANTRGDMPDGLWERGGDSYGVSASGYYA